MEAFFDFRTDDWSGLSKWAHFTKGEVTYDINLVGDKITKDMHLNLEAGTWEVKLHGTNEAGNMRVTTNAVFIIVDSYGSTKPGEVLPEVPLSAAEQIDAKAQIAKENSDIALKKATEVSEAAARGDFNFKIAAYFDTFEELENSIIEPIIGVPYCVGTEEPYLFYIWDGTQWRNNGFLGARGEDGITPEISVNFGNNGKRDGHAVTIKIGNEVRYFFIPDGIDGRSIGIDFEKIAGGHRVTTYSAAGPRSFDVMDGSAADLSEVEERLLEAEKSIADILYVPIDVVSFSHNAGIKENGDSISSVVLTWKLNKVPEMLNVAGNELTPQKEGSITINEEVASQKTFSISVEDEREAIASKSTTVYFYDGIYYGCAEEPDSVDSEFILSLTKKLSSAKNLSGLSVTGGEGKYFWYAYPASMKESIFNIGGFDYEYAAQTISFTNGTVGKVTKNYRVYKSTFPIPGSISVTIKDK